MATKQTWDTSRTGGGTYEFTQDAQGNYNLNSVGFQKLGKLNLPDLKAETTTTKDTATASAQTAKAFGDVQPFYYDKKGEGGTDTQYTMRKEGDLSTDIQPMVSSDRQPGFEVSDTMARDTKPTKGLRIGMAGYEAPPNVYTGLTPDTKDRLGRVIKKGTYDQAPKSTTTDRLGRPSPVDTTVQRIKPSDRQPGFAVANLRKTEVTPTKLRNVKTSLKTLANTVGIALNPAVGIGKMLLGTVTDTPTQKHARQYFNTVGNTSRISGNPAEDLYAGINQTSAFGNVEKAGERRIATREATIARKGYKAGNKFYDNTQKMKDDQENYKNSLENVAEKGFTRTRAERKASPGRQDREGGGNGGGGGGKSIICTQMYQHTQLEDWKKTMQLWYIFQKKYLTIEHQKGYHFLFKPFVNGMKKSKVLTTIGKYCAIARTNDIKHIMFGTPFSFVGRLVRLVTEPICYLTGKIKSWL